MEKRMYINFLSFEVDVSACGCGMNSALYFMRRSATLMAVVSTLTLSETKSFTAEGRDIK